MKTIALLLFTCIPFAVLGQGSFGFSVAFETLDANGDGHIDKDEARRESRLYSAFMTYDTDNDSAISRREYQRFLGPRPPPRATE